MVHASDRRALHISVALVTPAIQELVPLEVPQGTTVAQAIARTGLVERYGLDPAHVHVAVFGQRRRLDAVVVEGDRLELLRALEIDPKEARRTRAKRP